MEKQLSYRGNEVGFKNSPNVFVPILAIIFFLFLSVISIYKMFYDVKISSDIVAVKDIQDLAEIIDKINKDCKILDFERKKISINFLTVKSFVSSEIGSISLMYPKNWKGPYVQDNPEIQGKEYQIVKTKKGYFIVPGDGVKLSSGKVIGKDIILDENTDVAKMIKDGGVLNFDGKPLALPVNIGSKNISKFMMQNILKASEDLAINVKVSPEFK